MMLATAVFVLVLGTVMTAKTEVNSAVEWSVLDNVAQLSSALSSSSSAANSATETLLQQTSSLMGGISEQMVPIQQQIRNQLPDGLSGTMSMMDARQYEYLREALNSAVSSSFSPQQLQLINDVVSMTGASYAYDAAQREMDIHRECIAAAYQDLSSAAQIAVSAPGRIDIDSLAQLKNHVLSAVQHLQDSCPLCRALKYAANDANQNFLPFVTVLCSSVLRTLHPFVAESSSSP